MPTKNCYYDVDSILAEEELVPCTTQFDFAFLRHLDPDAALHGSSTAAPSEKKNKQDHSLPENSRLKLPFWVVEKWLPVGFIKFSFPRHYGRKARERLEADPTAVDLRKRNQRFFWSGQLLVNLMEQYCKTKAKEIRSGGSRSRRRRNDVAEMAALEQSMEEAANLRQTLLSTYTGPRLRHTLDWALSSVGDDVTSYVNKLSVLEQRLFACGAKSATRHAEWKLQGHGRQHQQGRLRRPSRHSFVTIQDQDSLQQRGGKRRRRE